MKMKLYRTTTASAVSIRMECSTLSAKQISATLSDRPPYTYAVVDGLLWWALNRKLEAFVALHMHHKPPVADELMLLGTKLLHYVQTAPYHNAEGEKAMRIGNTITKHLPELASLINANPRARWEHAELVTLAKLIRDRIAHPGDGGYGIADLLLDAPNAAAA